MQKSLPSVLSFHFLLYKHNTLQAYICSLILGLNQAPPRTMTLFTHPIDAALLHSVHAFGSRPVGRQWSWALQSLHRWPPRLFLLGDSAWNRLLDQLPPLGLHPPTNNTKVSVTYHANACKHNSCIYQIQEKKKKLFCVVLLDIVAKTHGRRTSVLKKTTEGGERTATGSHVIIHLWMAPVWDKKKGTKCHFDVLWACTIQIKQLWYSELQLQEILHRNWIQLNMQQQEIFTIVIFFSSNYGYDCLHYNIIEYIQI